MILYDIYKFIMEKFFYYRDYFNVKGWKGFICYNFVFNECFIKFFCCSGMKGYDWVINLDYEDMFDCGSFFWCWYRFKDGLWKKF